MCKKNIKRKLRVTVDIPSHRNSDGTLSEAVNLEKFELETSLSEKFLFSYYRLRYMPRVHIEEVDCVGE